MLTCDLNRRCLHDILREERGCLCRWFARDKTDVVDRMFANARVCRGVPITQRKLQFCSPSFSCCETL